MKNQKWYQRTRFYRWLTQGIIFFFIIHLIIQQAIAEEGGEAAASAEAYCPLGGLESLYFYITEGKTLSHLHLANLALLGIVVLMTVFLRSGFCSWLCPFGTLQDGIRSIGKKIGTLHLFKPAQRSLKRFVKKHHSFIRSVDHALRYMKYAVLAWAVLGAFYYGELVFRDYDPFVAFIKVTELEAVGGMVILGLTLLLSLFIDRPWCKYACPLGAFIGIIGKISPVRIKRNEAACKNCNLCTKACPMNIEVAKKQHVTSVECNHCMSCVDACSVKDALNIGFINPVSKKERVS